MKDFWNTIQSSGLASVLGGLIVWIFCQVVYAFITAKTQHKYNKELEEEKALIKQDSDIRLERYRLEFNQILSEYQIRFGYWYTEKAKAINGFYKEISKMYSIMSYIVSKERVSVCSAQEREDIKNQLANQRHKYKEEWMCLKLYVDQEEERLIEEFISKETKFFLKYLVNKATNDRDSFVKEGKMIIDDMSSIMEDLRQQFQKILTSQSKVMKNYEKERKADDNG